MVAKNLCQQLVAVNNGGVSPCSSRPNPGSRAPCHGGRRSDQCGAAWQAAMATGVGAKVSQPSTSQQRSRGARRTSKVLGKKPSKKARPKRLHNRKVFVRPGLSRACAPQYWECAQHAQSLKPCLETMGNNVLAGRESDPTNIFDPETVRDAAGIQTQISASPFAAPCLHTAVAAALQRFVRMLPHTPGSTSNHPGSR